jgi:hypothetical protein
MIFGAGSRETDCLLMIAPLLYMPPTEPILLIFPKILMSASKITLHFTSELRCFDNILGDVLKYWPTSYNVLASHTTRPTILTSSRRRW